MNNIIEHPCRKRRIAQATAIVVKSLRRLGREELLSAQRHRLDDLITFAVVNELEVPGSGLAALKRGLDQRGEA